jgi:hypothetical protein
VQSSYSSSAWFFWLLDWGFKTAVGFPSPYLPLSLSLSLTHLLALVVHLLVRRAVAQVVVADPGVERHDRLHHEQVAEVVREVVLGRRALGVVLGEALLAWESFQGLG